MQISPKEIHFNGADSCDSGQQTFRPQCVFSIEQKRTPSKLLAIRWMPHRERRLFKRRIVAAAEAFELRFVCQVPIGHRFGLITNDVRATTNRLANPLDFLRGIRSAQNGIGRNSFFINFLFVLTIDMLREV